MRLIDTDDYNEKIEMTREEAISMLLRSVATLDALNEDATVPDVMRECMHDCRDAAMALLEHVEEAELKGGEG